MCARGVMLMVTVAGHREKAGALVRWKGAVHKAWARERLSPQKQRSNSLTTTGDAIYNATHIWVIPQDTISG